MFEDEYRQIQLNPIHIEYLLKDSCMLFPPTTTPLSGVEFIKRLPSGDIEKARRVNLYKKKKDCLFSEFIIFSRFVYFFFFEIYFFI